MADKELLSALMDGETASDALIAELVQDVESQDTWKNYHLIGDVMRGEAPETVNWNIAASVAQALDTEPSHLPVAVPLIESQPTPARAKRQLPVWLMQFGQVGVAACVSLVVIVGVQQYGDSESSSFVSKKLPVLQTVPLSGTVEPVSLTRESVTAKQSGDAHLTEQRRRINAMLQDYELQLRLSSEQSTLSRVEKKSVIE